ncbi:MAG: pyridoxal phosphate-dependent aminotransferase [Gemmatales bacterium]|nr:pyridoxal phosphate-dependent aminotransferase [Gemmatales bacterium]MDW8175194.1 pyridoxal phosphate-dependent aminotransferase [Gemmatales bacterium]
MSLQLSAIARQIQPSATLAAGAKAKQLRAQGIQVFDFSLGEPDFPTPEHICRAAVEAMNKGHTHYTPANGIPELRAAIARSYERHYGLGYQPEEVIVSNGAKHAIYNVVAALCGPGDEVLIPAPGWVSYFDIVQMTGAKPVWVPTSSEHGFKLTPQQLRSALTPRSRLLLLNSPHNPTGSVYTPAELKALAEVVLDSALLVLSDEIYERLTYDDYRATCFATLGPELRQRTFTVSGVSKTYAMTGWRIGWACGPVEAIRAMANIQSQQTGNPCSISQYAALAALEGDQHCVEQIRQELAARRELVCRRLQAMPDVRLIPCQGAFFAFFDVSAYLGRRWNGQRVNNSAEFCVAALELAHINLVPGSAFGIEGYVRLSFACPRSELEAGLDALERFLKSSRS